MMQKGRGILRAVGFHDRANHQRLRLGERSASRRGHIEPLESRMPLASDLVISEFMATNATGLRDADGDFSDWIEVYNRGTQEVHLGGWHLTDEKSRLGKWEFPDITLSPGHSILVFASDKDRSAVGGEFHANFRLSGSGEFLALVSPDGSTIVDSYDPYPPQFADVSYGPEQTETVNTWVNGSTSSRTWIPTSNTTDVPSNQWTTVGYQDSSWLATPASIGFDQDPLDGDYRSLINNGGLLSSMAGQTASAYLRTKFQVNQPLSALDDLQLRMQSDDGYVVYLNGTEVARKYASDPLSWSSTATQANGSSGTTVTYANFIDLDKRADFNLVGTASWQGLSLRLTPPLANQTGAAWLKEPIQFGSDYSFSASMIVNLFSPGGTTDADGRGGDGMTFVLQADGSNRIGLPGGALGLEGAGMTFLAVELDSISTGSFDPDANLPSHVGINTSASGNIARAAVPRFNGHPTEVGQPGPGAELRYLWVEYTGSTQRLDVYFSSASAKPAAPTVSATVDLAQLFGGVSELWTGFTAATGDAWNGHDLLAYQLKSGSGQLGFVPQLIDLSDKIDAVRVGDNVLAIHGLNVSASDNDFLLRPELTAISRVEGDAKFFARPTPGALNGLGDSAPTGEVLFSSESRTFAAAFDLTLTPPNPQAQVRYTTNGDLPSATSTLYTGPIRITSTAKIRARAFEVGKGAGPTRSESFIAIDTSLTSFEQGTAFSSNLPILIFESYNRNVDSQSLSLVPVSSLVIDPGADGKASILDAADFGGRAGMRIRGQTSEGFPKKQYALELWDEFNADTRTWDAGAVDDKPVSLLGLPSESDWVLNGPYSDKTQLNNYLTFLWSNKAGQYAPRARLVEVFLNQNGGSLNYASDYRGTYVLLEKIKRDGDRVDIEELTPEMNSLPEISGGYIWKKDKPGAGDVPFTTSRGQELRMVEPDDATITPTQKNWLRTYINQFESALYGSRFADPVDGYAKYIDVDSWVDTWLLVELTKNIDGFRLSTYYHKDRDGKIKQGPAWDYNLSLANGNYLNGAFPEGWYGEQLSDTDYPYWRRLFEDPNFRQRVVDRWHELRQGPWSTPSLMGDIDAAVAQLSNGNPRLDRPAVGEPSNPISRNFAKWGNVSTYAWPNCFFGQGSCPSSPLPGGRAPQQYADYIFILKDFVTRRSAWIDTQFPRGPALSPGDGLVDSGTSVSVTVPAGWEAYYTVDGSDPRNQSANVSERILVSSSSPVQTLVPQNAQLITACTGNVLPAPNACFIHPDYSLGTLGDSWKSGSQGVGYDREATYLPYIQSDLRTSMDGLNASAYVRIPFDVSADLKTTLQELKLRARYDDGFVAYLWSAGQNLPVEVARRNAPGTAQGTPIVPLSYNAAATVGRSDSDAILYESIDISSALPLLRTGRNVLVLQGLNSSATSSDFLLDVELAGVVNEASGANQVFKYNGPLVIDRNTQLNVRLRRTGTSNWSGLTTSVYVTSTPSIAITEINYHPLDPTLAELAQLPGITDQDFEFVEIRNTGATAAYPVRSRLQNGVEFEFPAVTLQPGESGLIVENEAAFRLRYGAGPRVLGQWSGNLSNGGEAIELMDGANRLIGSVTYDDSALWPRRADGIGSTLELVDPATPSASWSKFDQWQASSVPHGTPGAGRSIAPTIVINEVLSSPTIESGLGDSIELLNTGGTIVDLGGWYLSDSSQQLLKYRIPSGIKLGPGQYLVISENQFNPTPLTPLPNHFGLDGLEGDDVWLTIADGQGNVTQFVDDISFGPGRRGESFGLVPDGDGFLTPLGQLSLGRENGAPRVGPVLISELMYQPSAPSLNATLLDPGITSDDLEFIEVANPTSSAVSLTNWRLRGGVDFDFVGGSLDGGKSLLVVSFDPQALVNQTRLAAFRAHYGLANSVTLVGPYFGKLSADGDRVVLQRPAEPLPNEPSILPRLQEDEVIYDNRTPWPTAAGNGNSLNREGSQSYGNAPSSWLSKGPSPGTFQFATNQAGDYNGDGRTDGQDLAVFAVAYRSGSNDPKFDLNRDGSWNESDRDYMVRTLLRTDYGDANLDRQFDSGDLIQVFQYGQYEDGVTANSTWQEGDWNLDGEFDTGDLILAFQAGAYAPAAASPVRDNEFADLALALLSDKEAPRQDQTTGDEGLGARTVVASDSAVSDRCQPVGTLVPVVERLFGELEIDRETCTCEPETMEEAPWAFDLT